MTNSSPIHHDMIDIASGSSGSCVEHAVGVKYHSIEKWRQTKGGRLRRLQVPPVSEVHIYNYALDKEEPLLTE